MNQISYSQSDDNDQNCNIQEITVSFQDEPNNGQVVESLLPDQMMELQSYRKMFDFLQPTSRYHPQPIKLQQTKLQTSHYSTNKQLQIGYNGQSDDNFQNSKCMQGQQLSKQVCLSTSDKKRIANKIQQILARRLSQNKQSFVTSRQLQFEFADKKKKPPITLEMIQQFKKEFQAYNQSLELPHHQRMTFRDVANKLNVSLSLVTQLYDQHSKDPLLTNRINKVTEAYKHPNELMFKNPTLAQLRIKFIRDLLKHNGPLTQSQIARQMSKDERLCVRDRLTGKLQPIGRRAIQKLMKMGNLAPKRKLQITQMNFNDPQCIENRYRYAKRYLQLSEDKNADIYFLGQFSFAIMVSLSSCPPVKRDDFCDGKAPNTRHRVNSIDDSKSSVEDQANRKVQYLIVISIEGIIYYQIFANIFRDMNFPQTLVNIGRALCHRRPNQKKYLILQTSFLHKKSDLQFFQRSFPVKVIFLPPLTPMLNPTEYFFMEVKSVVKSRVYKFRQSYSVVLQQVLKQYRSKSMQIYYTCINPYVQLAVKHLAFK